MSDLGCISIFMFSLFYRAEESAAPSVTVSLTLSLFCSDAGRTGSTDEFVSTCFLGRKYCKQLYSAWVFSCKFVSYFQNTFS